MTFKRKKVIRKSLTVKQRISVEVANTPACKFWMPFNEGSGESFTEQVSGQTLASSVTSTYANPHAVNTYCFFLIVTLMEIAAPILALAQNIPTLPFALTPKLNSI